MVDDVFRFGFETRAIHAGQEPDPRTGAVIVPIYQTSTYAQDGVGGTREGDYEYSRTANPTRTALEQALASLEGGRHGLAFASGMAATDAVLRTLLRPGDHLVLGDDAYGGTFRLIDKVLTHWGVEYSVAHLSDLDEVRAAIRPETKLVWCESPTNPLLGIADIAALSGLAHSAGARLVVDNTFATPYLQNPLSLGADLVLHSTTKYLGGHSDVVGGAVITNEDELRERLFFMRNTSGAVPGPFDAFLTLRGIKTLAVRMERHCDNAELIANALVAHPKVAKVYYPGLPEHPGHEVAAKQMRRFGGMVSFTHADGEQAALDTAARTELFILAESLGGIESLIEHPGRMTHASVVGSTLQVPAELLRLSVGIEDSRDLLDDLLKALG
ncbi:cystathionine gamma-synthase [Amycolatopsis magusensis]|uniref:Cystathionine gamma-synthase n=1 Tax=Amycolatopsis magusensis TaxID=882444 RepID=A0ABS4PH95_9PSEU|nr:cystathionine gamma-synthase [Amycolatopsis magusensis]MBP2178774.1 cystathionine gamma-synthase [Amycolatopsis magusensis]MDI5982363.1 cystathionine gamma-synthase [Amycolatopsis magusensis]UJW35121.1 cystathionine gamma-synthase [Saccharothrix sp. AJ9571]